MCRCMYLSVYVQLCDSFCVYRCTCLLVHIEMDVFVGICSDVCGFFCVQVHMVRESNKSQNIKDESILDQCLQNRAWVLKVSNVLGSLYNVF